MVERREANKSAIMGIEGSVFFFEIIQFLDDSMV